MSVVADRSCQLQPERKSLTLCQLQPERKSLTLCQRTHAYTDGSAAEATRDGESGVYSRYNDGKAHITIATGNIQPPLRQKLKPPSPPPPPLKKKKKKKNPQLRSETTYSEPSPMWSSSQMLSLSSTSFKNPSQKALSEMETALVDLTAQTNLTLQRIVSTPRDPRK